MTTPARRERPMFAELVDWLEGGFPGLPMMRPFSGSQVIRVEDYVEDDQYVLRAELPGIDADNDIEITVDSGVPTLEAERREEKEGTRSEFRYGAFTRSVTLPAGADQDAITATYGDGILEVRVGIKAPKEPEAKHITVGKK